LQKNLKKLFPVFDKNPDLVYLDNAATTHRPSRVIEAMNDFNAYENANIHRGVYDLSSNASARFENARALVAEFLSAEGDQNIAFTKGTTESINIVAQCFLRKKLKRGDNIIVSVMEHHANYIPWQMLAKEVGAELRVWRVSDDGDLDYDQVEKLIDLYTQFIAIAHVSNTLGTLDRSEQVIAKAQFQGVMVPVDAAQCLATRGVNIKISHSDFRDSSAHNMLGPFG